MRRYVWLLGAATWWAAACGPSVNVEQERNTLMSLDREWAQTSKDIDKWMSYYAPDASVYSPGMPVATGAGPIRETISKLVATPGLSIQWTPAKASVSSAGDIGYTAGTYQMTTEGATEKGKYVTVWKKQAGGQWKAVEDIFNADAAEQRPATPHAMVAAASLTWGDAPPSLPPGAKMAVVSGDPGKAAPFTLRLQLPAGYKLAPHWHPTDEHVTVLSGTMSLGMGETFDQAGLKELGPGGYAALPSEMRHFAAAKTATTVQVHGTGPFVVNYVNQADDPSRQKK